MKDKTKKCIKCGLIIEKIIDKDYPKLDYYYCNNWKCSRLGLLAVIFKGGK